MGRRGPRPTPTAILNLRGSWRGKVREGEPTPEAEIPPAPDWLDDLGRECWDDLARRLGAQRLLTGLDRNALARYCAIWSDWRRNQREAAKAPAVVKIRNRKGEVIGTQPSPLTSIRIKLGEQLVRLEREFGLTPAARVGLKVQAEAGGRGVKADDAEFFGNGATRAG